MTYPNESIEYRKARDALLKEEQELVDKVKSVAAKRRKLPRGGELKEDYVFQWANDAKVGKSVKFSDAIAKAPAEKINAWARKRGWSQIALLSGSESPFQADYKCQGESDDMQWPVMHVFRKQEIMSTPFGHTGTSWTSRRRGGRTFPFRRRSSGRNSSRRTI
jgi:predicted dithiol-disulfide oxidoreductase (DUF899 family)